MGVSVETNTIDLFKKDWILLSDFIDMWCSELISEGSHRMVYQFTLDESLVVKIDTTNGSFINVSEWDLYHNIKNSFPAIAKKYLAPVIQISNAGKVMLQKKTVPITDPKKLPKQLPAFLSADTKIQNFGLLDGKVVCHDYANHRLYKYAKTNLVKADWYSDYVSAPIKYKRKWK